jgi:hypothetical protein
MSARKVQFADEIKNCLLNSALNFSTKLYNNFNSAINRGMDLEFKISLQDYNHLEQGLGLRADEKIFKDKEVFLIPLSMGMNGLDLIDFKEHVNRKIIEESSRKVAKSLHPNDKFRQEKVYQNCILAWQILFSAHFENSYMHDMVEAFPIRDLTQPIYSRKELLEKIKSKNLIKYYHENNQFFDLIYSLLCRETTYDISIEEITWAFNCVFSRKLSILEQDTNSPYELLLPVVDYINHSSTQSNLLYQPYYERVDQRSYLSVVAKRDIEKGEQLFFDYGPYTNKKFVHMYGFFDRENPKVESDFYIHGQNLLNLLQIQPNSDEDETYRKFLYKIEEITNKENYSSTSQFRIKHKLLEKNNATFLGGYNEINLTLFPNKFDIKFLKFLRIIFLDNGDISEDNIGKVENHNFTNIYSRDNELKVYNFLKYILKKHISPIEEIDHEELISEIGLIDNVEKVKLKTMFLLEREEKMLLEKNIKYIDSKLNLI